MTPHACFSAAAAWLCRHVPARARRLHTDARGSAAVEFAYIAPVLLLMFLATVEIGRAVSMDRHFAMATQMAGDLIAREEWMGTSTTNAKINLDKMMESIQHIMAPYDTSTLELGIFSVRASTSDARETKVDWSYSFNGKSVPNKCQSYTLPDGMIEKGGSVIVVEGSFGYKPLFAGFVPGFSGNMTWTDRSFHSPRMNSCVDYVKPNGSSCLWSC